MFLVFVVRSIGSTNVHHTHVHIRKICCAIACSLFFFYYLANVWLSHFSAFFCFRIYLFYSWCNGWCHFHIYAYPTKQSLQFPSSKHIVLYNVHNAILRVVLVHLSFWALVIMQLSIKLVAGKILIMLLLVSQMHVTFLPQFNHIIKPKIYFIELNWIFLLFKVIVFIIRI